MDHIIYKITNTVNGKIYIGKTKKYYGQKVHGVERRFRSHMSSAKRNNGSGCPKLCNAIRKYGSDKFKIEQIEEADSDHIDEREEYHIKEYDSTNDKIGYNIALGGRGRKVVHVDEETREKISRRQNDDGELNIVPYKEESTGKIIGYRARRIEKGKHYERCFANKKFTPEENKQTALDYIQAVKNGTDEEFMKKYDESICHYMDEEIRKKISKAQNVETEMNIRPYKDKITGEIIGYQVRRRKDGKQYGKHFSNKKITPEENYQKAIDFIQALKNNTEDTYVKYNKENELPKNIAYVLDRKDKNKILGYFVSISIKGKGWHKSFQSKDKSLEELLKSAIEYKEDILKDAK